MPAQKAIGGSKSFPHKLHSLLESATESGFSHIISWQPGGKSFRVHQPKVFVKSILPQHFKQTKFKSFLRQLNIYGFQRIQHGPNKGGYAHQSLVQGVPKLCNNIKRVSAPEHKLAPIAEQPKPALVRKRSNNSISTNTSNISGLSNLFKAAGSTGSLGSIGSLGMNGPEVNFPSSGGAQNATFHTNSNAFGFGSTGSLGSLGAGSLGLSSTTGKQNAAFRFFSDDLSAFGKPFSVPGSGMSVLSNLSGGNMSLGSNGSTGLRMHGTDLSFFKDLFQPSDLEGEVPMICPSTGRPMSMSTPTTSNNRQLHQRNNAGAGASASAGPEYVASHNGFLTKKRGLFEPSTDELLGLVTEVPKVEVPKNEDLNRSESVFPTKLHRMLQDAKREGFENIVSWIHGGTAFKVHDVTAFMQKIMPIYFDQSKFESFRRQLNLYGFTRVTRGPSRGMYYHQEFVQNDVALCKNITRPKTARKKRRQESPTEVLVTA